MNSPFFNLNITDLAKGLIVSVLTSALTIIYDTVSLGSLVFDWKHIATVSLTSAVAYLLKNFLTNSSGDFLKKN
jgi:hypothetical protein